MEGEGLSQRQPTEREAMLRGKIIPRAMNLCEYLDREGIAKLNEGHGVEDKIVIQVGMMAIQVTLSVRKAD